MVKASGGKEQLRSSHLSPSRSYGADCLSYDEIQKYVDEFIQYAKDNPTEEFQVTQVGCGLAG